MNDPDPQSRVRVTSPQTANRTRRRTPLSAATEIDAQSEVGQIFFGSLLRAQLRLTLGVLLTLALTVGSLPVLFRLFPEVTHVYLLGMPLAWCILGFGIYPALLLLGFAYVRRAERIEDAFADVIEGP